jgi:hypothetical protein
VPLTALEREEALRNGWDEAALLRYRLERDRAAGAKVGGNIVTEFTRPKPALRVERAMSKNPHKWGR